MMKKRWQVLIAAALRAQRCGGCAKENSGGNTCDDV